MYINLIYGFSSLEAASKNKIKSKGEESTGVKKTEDIEKEEKEIDGRVKVKILF